MTRKCTILIVLLTAIYTCNGQLHGAQWVIGPYTTRIDFRNDTVIIDSIAKLMWTTGTNAAISDSAGNLLYYTNGEYIAGCSGDSLFNGGNLNPCSYTSNSPNGLDFQQGAMFLPMPGNNRYYYLFHYSGDSTGGHPGTLFYSIIDKNGNNGLGEVIRKNIPYYKSVFRAGGMTACKHANGRDWWIIMAAFDRNRFYKFLLTPDGISDTLMQDIGPVYNGPFDNAYSCFSPDGSKFATGCYEGLITVLDFDRCTGEFSNFIKISNIPSGYTISGSGSIAFSPNGRFVYIANRINLVQYDLLAPNIQDSVEIYLANDSDNAQIYMVALADNGKIYGSTWNGGFYFLHVVNYPDSFGHSSGFVWGGQPTLSEDSWNLPNMPNYKLGVLIGSGCDTIKTGVGLSNISDETMLRIMPNPANKYLYVEMGMQGNYEFDLLSESGQVVSKKETRQVDIFDTENLATGTYFLRVTNRNTTISLNKIIIEH